MSLQDDIRAYKNRWEVVAKIQIEERRSASLVLRWMQLNAAFGMAKALGLLQPDPSEMGVYERWAKLKEKASEQTGN